MAQIFISYSRADKQFIEQFIPLIRKVYGNDSLWFDDDIHGGSDWWQLILDEIADCDLFIYLVSNESLESSYCQAELKEALRLNKQILPVVVRRLNPAYPGNIQQDLAELLRKTQYVDMSRGFKSADTQAVLYGSINRLLQAITTQTQIPRETQATPQPIVEDKIQRDSSAWIAGGFLLLSVIIAGIFGLWQGVFANNPETATEIVQVATDEIEVTFDPVQASLTAIISTSDAQALQTQAIYNITETHEADLVSQENANQTQIAIDTEVYLGLATAITWTPTATQIPTLVPPTLTQTLTAPPVPPTPTATLDPLSQALERAWNFTGTSNDDWQTYIHTFEDGHEMALVPVGCFAMGSNEEAGEQPVHEQCIEEPFWIDITEITNQEYASLGCEDRSSEPNEPRNCVTWFDSLAYCQARNGSLPTEHQWEYAARGVESYTYPWGNEWNPDNANWADTEPDRAREVGSYANGISWVGAKDMAGNLWEWTSSIYLDYPYDVNDGPEDLEDTASYRMLRGGAFFYGSNFLRSAYRYGDNPDFSSFNFGFRCVLSAPVP